MIFFFFSPSVQVVVQEAAIVVTYCHSALEFQSSLVQWHQLGAAGLADFGHVGPPQAGGRGQALLVRFDLGAELAQDRGGFERVEHFDRLHGRQVGRILKGSGES